MRNVLKKDTFRTFKAHFSPRKPTSYNDYDHGAMPLSFADFRSRPCNRICSESILQGIKDKARKRAPPFA